MSARQKLSNLTRPSAHKGGRALTRSEKHSRTELTGGFARIEQQMIPGNKNSTDKKSTY